MIFSVYRFNNYYNRTLKRFDSLEEYGEPVEEIEGVNFNPANSINTTQVINYGGEPINYAILHDENNRIISRWFIIDSRRNLAGQYILTLYRDLLAEYKDQILTSTVYIEKGWTNSNDPAIYNREDFQVNEIKTSEHLLRDLTQIPWIVGYYDKSAPPEALKGSVDIKQSNLSYIEVLTLQSWEYYDLTRDSYPLRLDQNQSKIKIATYGDNYFNQPRGYIVIEGDENVTFETSDKAKVFESNLKINAEIAMRLNIGKTIEGVQNQINEKGFSDLFGAAANLVISDKYSPEYLESLNQRLLRVQEKFYRISIRKEVNTFENIPIVAGDTYNKLVEIVKKSEVIIDGNSINIFNANENPNNKVFSMVAHTISYKIELSEAPEFEATFDLSESEIESDDKSVEDTQGAPYNIFAIPYGSIHITYKDGDTTRQEVYGSVETAMATASAIQKNLQAYLYDIQLLPYFPDQVNIEKDINYPIIHTPSNRSISFVKSIGTQAIHTFIYHCVSDKFIVDNIDLEPHADLHKQKTALDRKVVRQCNKYRLTSPNYANYFDFNVELNNGTTYFTADCQYKPYSPYIHINPSFSGLYGRDYNDPRGLILGGDFSLTQITDQWRTYQINNKNYEKTFERQIENMETQQQYGRTQDIFNMITGTFSGAASGGMSGMMIGSGNPISAIAGAVAGGAASLAGGIADISINEALRDEAKEYTQDLYNFNMQNIQALPITLSKVSAFNPNNKVFPILEIYTCTETEKKAFMNKLKYNGMTIGRIGTLKELIDSLDANDVNDMHYFKAILIRINIDLDHHISNMIASELNKGVYI